MTDAGGATRSTATWVQTPGGPIWAGVEEPRSGQVRGVVVLVPSVALEGVVTWRALRRLSRELTAEGYSVVRFSWSGDGDSRALEPHDDAVHAWHDDLRAVTRLARSLAASGAPVVAVALRVGAALVDGVRDLFDDVVLWEPVDGRQFVRVSTTLRRMHVAAPLESKEIVEFCGASYPKEQLAGLRAAVPPSDARAVWTEPDQAPLFYGISPQNAIVPVESVHDVVREVARDDSGWWERQPWTPVDTTTMTTADGHVVRERLVSIGRHQLPAVISEPLDGEPARRTFVFTAAGAEPRFAPSRVWVDGAREVAALGCAAVRADRRGLGEAWEPVSDRAPLVYSERVVEDVEDILDWAARTWPAPVVAGGSCVGSWALMLGNRTPLASQLLLFEPQAWCEDPTLYVQHESGNTYFRRAPVARGLRADTFGETRRYRIVIKSLLTRLRPTVIAMQTFITTHVPESVWERLARANLVEYPYLPLVKTDPATQTELHFDHRDWDGFVRSRGQQSLERLHAQGRSVTATLSDALDHSIYSLGARRYVIGVLKRAAQEQPKDYSAERRRAS